MTDDKIIRYNNIIAKFMGGVRKDDGEYWVFEDHPCGYLKSTNGFVALKEDLFYHLKFDWMVRVMERVKQLGFNVDISIPANVAHTLCTIDGIKDKAAYYEQTYDSNPLSAIYNAVVKFIIWYNQQFNQS